MNESIVTNGTATATAPAKEPSTVGILDEFQTDLAARWRQLPNKTFFFGLLAAWLAFFHFLGNSVFGYISSPSLFVWMVTAYNGNKEVTDDAHGNFIPL